MTPAERTTIEDMLRRAYADASATVPDDDFGPGLSSFQPRPPSARSGGPAWRSRWLIPASAAAAVAIVVLVAALVAPKARQPGEPVASVPRQMAYVVGAGEVMPVDIATGVALRPIKLGVPGGPAGYAVTPDGRTIYVVTFRGYVVPVDTVTRTAGPAIRIGGVPFGLLISRDGRTGYVMEPPYGVAVVDFTLNRLAGFIRVDDAASFALTPDGNTLYVANRTGSTVTPIDTASLTPLRPVTTTENMPEFARIAMAPDGSTAYVEGGVEHGHDFAGAYGVLTPISTATNKALRPIKLSNAAESISFSHDGRTAYLTGSAGVTAIDLASGKISWTANLPATIGSYEAATSADGQIIDLLGVSPIVFRIQAATGALLAPIRAGTITWNADELAVSPDGKTLYVQSYTVGPRGAQPTTMISVSAATGKVGRVIRLAEPGYLLFGPS